MASIKLTMACHAESLEPLYEGAVGFEGIDLEIERIAPRERHQRMTHEAPWQICEFSTAGLMGGLGKLPFSAVPVFPLREFRHRGIWVRAESDVQDPTQLNGKRIGIQNWDNSAAIWQKGALALDYGLDIASVAWTAQIAVESEEFAPPPWLNLTVLPRGKTLQEALLAGQLDAVMLPMPHPFEGEDAKRVRRLFPDFVAAEQEFFRRHGVFPIMHTIVIRHDVLDAHPFVAKAVYQGVTQALERYVEQNRAENSKSPVWPGIDWARQEQQLGAQPWPGGLMANRAALEMSVDFAVSQGLVARRISPDDLFQRDGEPLVAAD